MEPIGKRIVRWSGVVAMCVAVAACGGGGGGADGVTQSVAPPPPAPVPDARNGSYTMMAADARVYTLVLDFDARTFHVTGDGVDTVGSLQEQSGTFLFIPGNGTGASGFSTLRFQMATDAAIGEFALPSGAVPFVAARKFATAISDAAGVYNLLGRTVDTAGGPADTTIQQGQITADGRFRTCEDLNLYDIVNCPAASIASGTITVSGDLFSAVVAGNTIPFRVAQVGVDRIFLRASASAGTTRRFVVGMEDRQGLNASNYTGGTTEAGWGTFGYADNHLVLTSTHPDGTSTTLITTPMPAMLPAVSVLTAGAENFFGMRSLEMGMIVAARGSSSSPGFVFIGRTQ